MIIFCISHWQRNWESWQRFWWLYHLHRRRDGVERLIMWADRKRLTLQCHYYKYLRGEFEQLLSQYNLHHYKTCLWAWRLYIVMKLLFPQAPYKKGAAAEYRLAALRL